MNEIRIPLPNGTQLIFFQNEELPSTESESLEERTDTQNQPTSDAPLVFTSLDELQEISLALIYYKTYLKNKGQQDKAIQIGEIDHKIYQTLQNARNVS